MQNHSTKPVQPSFYHAIASGASSEKYTLCWNINGTLDSFFQEETLRLVSSYSNKTGDSGIICGSVKPFSTSNHNEVAIVGLLSGELEEVMCLDSRRTWFHKCFDNRATAAAYSSQAKWILAGNPDGQLSAFDAESKKPLFERFDTHYSELFHLQLLEEVNTVVCFSVDARVSLWDLRSMDKMASMKMVNPMKSALFIDGCQLFYSSFEKYAGVRQFDLRNMADDSNRCLSVLDDIVRVQALRPISSNRIGCVCEDNSGYLIDQVSGQWTTWEIAKWLEVDSKIMDFCFDGRNNTIKVCGDQFVKVVPLEDQSDFHGNGWTEVLPEPNKVTSYNNTFEDLSKLVVESDSLPIEEL